MRLMDGIVYGNIKLLEQWIIIKELKQQRSYLYTIHRRTTV